MPETKGRTIIVQLQKKWTYQGLLFNLLVALSISLFVTPLLHTFLLVNIFWGIPVCLFLFILISVTNKGWKLSELDISRFLNHSEPSLQESTALVLEPYDSLNGLQKLQLQQVEVQLSLLRKPTPLKRKLTIAALALLFAGMVCMLLLHLPVGQHVSNQPLHTSSPVIHPVPEVVLPEVTAVKLTIHPPSYTGKKFRTQDKFNVEVEEGSVVIWNIETNMAIQNGALIFNDGSSLPLLPIKKKGNTITTQKKITKPGFYQLQIGTKLSELYKIEVVKDRVPTITIQTPKPNTTIEYGQPERVSLSVTINDDYGIKAATISATTSSGEGEGVKFKEQKLSFANFTAGGRNYNLKRMIDLKALGMQPGDELYFFVAATDTYNQEVRSDVYIVTLQDTTDLMSMDGMVNGLDIKPELFRSERQIIIETEQLLKDKATITAEAFKRKADDLGVDQKLLRLRYGKFLGEETDTEIGTHEHPENDMHEGHTDNAADIIAQYGHAHDNAEDATFFDAATKKQLKETLAEMWKAELQLRTFNPKLALPFEYKALRLLKDLQQKSRAYVPKTGFTATPLKSDKRLTGDLSKIVQPVVQQTFQKDVSPLLTVRSALGILEVLKNEGVLNDAAQEILGQAFQQLSSKAAQNPALFLPSLSSMKKILNDEYRLRDINTAENGLQKILPPPATLPSATTATNDMNLSGRYFNNLNRSIRQK